MQKCLNKLMPCWATYGAYLSILPMPHDYFNKELPNYYIENNLNNVTHLFYGNDVIIETIRKNDNMRRRTRSDKVYDSACRTLNFGTPMGLSFEYTCAVGGRASESQILEWLGSALPHKLDIDKYKNYFRNNELLPPKQHWVSTDEDISPIYYSSPTEEIEELELIEMVVKKSKQILNSDGN